MSEHVQAQQLATETGNVPSYSGTPSEDVSRWAYLFRLLVVSKTLNPMAAKLQLICLLHGDAKKFYEFIGGDELQYEEVLSRLVKCFERDTRAQTPTNIKMLVRTADQSLAAFIEHYVVLARRCGSPEEIQVDWITDHLPQQVNIMLATFSVADVELSVERIL